MRILFVHQNFPAQYVHIAQALAADTANEVVALASSAKASVPPGVRVVAHNITRGNTPEIHPFAADFETKIIRAQAAAEAAERLKAEGFVPDIICGHAGWGETLFLRDVWPEARQLTYMEFFYRGRGGDFGFDPEFGAPAADALWRLRARNASFLMALESTDWAVSPTRWQRSQLPASGQTRTSVVHEGVDTRKIRPNPNASITLGRAGVCRVGDEIVTFVNRNLEPYRGYHSFIRAVPEILARRPKARVVLVGGEGVSYGSKPPEGRTWKDIFLAEVSGRIDMSRVHFVGQVPYATYLNLLQVSAAHVYLTYPFVLSWSMLESMAAECLVIGSRTQPVEEVIEHGRNGLLVDFFSPEAIAAAVVEALANPKAYREMRRAARRTVVERYDLASICLPAHLRLIGDVAEGRTPATEG